VAKTKDLVYLGRGEGICVHELKAITSGEEVISSTLIRKSMMTGQFAKALKLLGHPMIVIGEVVHGKKIARKLGFPTANIQIKDRLYPPFGIYGAKLQLEGEDRIRYGVINVGVNPTLKPGEFSLEVHILDFDEDIYGKKMYIELMEYLRKEANNILRRSKHFSPASEIGHLAEMASVYVSQGNQCGEGWFLTGEMMELIKSGVPNIVCVQPFGCLPNHVMGKGVIKVIRNDHPDANIVAIDYDPGASEVNQLNRIKLMLSTAFKNIES
ncbi:MAG: hypothetical protein HUJ54_13605, partial [Erysipelotrichaceae bacterium]|nr:hypothetical protein [Erysipelotrichaceae bacterium]